MVPIDLQQAIDDHYDAVVRTAWILCGDRWEADEIAQDTFLKAIDAAARFDGRSSARTWLIGICINLHRSRVRSAIRRMKRYAELAKSRSDCDTHTPDLAMQQRQWRQGLWRAVRRLPPRQAEVVVLKYAEDMTLAQVAATLGIAEGTAKSRLHHALAKLRQRKIEEPPESSAERIPATAELSPVQTLDSTA